MAASGNQPTVELQQTCDAAELPDADQMAAWLQLTAEAAGRDLPAHATLHVRIVDEAESRTLNREYRGKDGPTNVLAFPAELDSMPGLPSGADAHLGDLVMCAPVVLQEAAQQGKRPGDHWAHLLVHGTLHLFGFDHQNSDEADIMEALEVRILGGQGLGNPYDRD